MFTSVSPATSDAELIDLVTFAERSRSSLDANQAQHMLTYVDRARVAGERMGGVRAGKLEASAAAHELSLALMLPVGTVEGMIATARRVRATLPTVWAAWHAGDVSTRKIVLIDQAAQRLARTTSLAILDNAVVDIAVRKTPGQLRSWLDRFVERLEAASIDTRLDSEARSLPTSDPRTHDQARADMLTDLLLGAAGNGHSTSTTIGVIVPIQSLMGLSDAPGELADRSASIPASLIRAKAIEPGTLFWRLLTDETGKLLDATSIGRYAAGKLGQAIRFRDGSSAFPTSTVPANRCDIDHTESWPAPTTASNLGPLHRRAHNLKTAGLLSMRQPEPGVFKWITRTGHRYTHTSDPLPVTATWDDTPNFPIEFVEAIAAMPPALEPYAA